MLASRLAGIAPYRVEGRVRRARGLLLTCDGLNGVAAMGETWTVERPSHNPDECETALLAEVVGVDEDGVHLLPFDELAGIGQGARVAQACGHDRVWPGRGWLGRVIDPLARPLDDGPPLARGPRPCRLQERPLAAHLRRELGPRMALGVRALDLFTPCRRGQRLGIFAGSGVGKSTLLAMLARHAEADAIVLGLVGERGREVQTFLAEALGTEGRRRAVVVVATSDMPAMLRRRAAQLTLTVAEALRDQGLSVVCLIDSVTRFAMALREIHLAAGEPPASKGYPASVFAELPRLLERAGPGAGAGSITGLFTVLVEGDDLADPVADAVRAILDGHVVLDRAVAEGGRFPAIEVTRSLSRTAPGCYDPAERPLVARARQLIRAHAEMAELIQLGAYKPGSDPLTDAAIAARPALEALLAQAEDEPAAHEETLARLAEIVAAAEG
jgi:flagellum-specific ATP synthase